MCDLICTVMPLDHCRFNPRKAGQVLGLAKDFLFPIVEYNSTKCLKLSPHRPTWSLLTLRGSGWTSG
jgi:hypothetical protein